jgi:hypothetical protein
MRLILTLLAALAVAAPAHRQSDSASHVCRSEYESAGSASSNLGLPNGNPFDVNRAMTLFRFARQKEALQELDSALITVSGPWRWRVRGDRVKPLTTSLEAFRRCMARTAPPSLATLTLDVILPDPDAPGKSGTPLAGAEVEVEGTAIGRTGPDGSLTAHVPSGAIRVTAQVPPSRWGEGYVTIPPNDSAHLSIMMHEGKEVSEDTTLVVSEAVDDIVPGTSPSFTFKFMRGNTQAPIARISYIHLLDRHQDVERILDELFTIADGAIVARHAAALFDALATSVDKTIAVRVSAEDAAGRMHNGEVRFRAGLSRLRVTLAPPPSNPALPVSNIAVGVSVVGAGIAVQAVSDAEGRFELEAVPHGTLALDCETVFQGLYYYCAGLMSNWGEQSITLVLRHVTDLKNGVPALLAQPNAPASPHAGRRKGR